MRNMLWSVLFILIISGIYRIWTSLSTENLKSYMEIVSGLLLFILLKDEISLDLLQHVILIIVVIISAITDIKWGIIPNKVSLFGVLIGLLFGIIKGSFLFHFLGLVMGFFTLGIIFIAFPGGLGAGDVKMASAIGALIGPKLTLSTIFLSFFLGALFGIGLVLFKGKSIKTAIPFGPFLGIGAIISILWGDSIISYYLVLFSL